MNIDVDSRASSGQPIVEDQEIVNGLIKASGVRPTDHVTVAGHKTLEVVLSLFRRGYLHATCRSAAEGPHVAENFADSIWILNTENAAELRTLIAMLSLDLLPSGTLVFNLAPQTPTERTERLGEVLTKCGFASVQSTRSSDGTLLLTARRRPPLED